MTASCTEIGSGRGVTVQRPCTHPHTLTLNTGYAHALPHMKVSKYIQFTLTHALTDKVLGSCTVTDTKPTYRTPVLFIYVCICEHTHTHTHAGIA